MSRPVLLAFTASFLLATSALQAAQNHTLVVPPASVPAPTFATAQSPNSETLVGWHFAPGGLAGAFRYQAGQVRRLPNTGIGQHALGIRGNDEVTGYQDVPLAGGSTAQRAFRSTAASGTVDLGTLGGDNSWASSTSGLGPLIAGSSQRADGLFRAFRIQTVGAPMQELPGLGGPEAGANGCNDAVVVGWAENILGEKRAVVWDAAASIAELPTLGGALAEAIFVQENGMVCGWSETAGGEIHACLWDLNSGSAAIDLGTLGGSESRALSMNAAGDVVGSAQRSDGSFGAFF
jgi:probable HAF family extracellular repeat protein